jgi:hypothetical protein
MYVEALTYCIASAREQLLADSAQKIPNINYAEMRSPLKSKPFREQLVVHSVSERSDALNLIGGNGFFLSLSLSIDLGIEVILPSSLQPHFSSVTFKPSSKSLVRIFTDNRNPSLVTGVRECSGLTDSIYIQDWVFLCIDFAFFCDLLLLQPVGVAF